MKIAVIIPDRGDRPAFMENCMRQLKRQTLLPESIIIMSDPPQDDKVDITLRYRLGYDICRGRGIDLIAFIENDDWYSPHYLEVMAGAWEKSRPDLFGTNYTIYYHLKLRKYFKMQHDQRASAMNTFIKPDLEITWGKDHDPYTDAWLWMGPFTTHLSKQLIIDQHPPLSIGMKHGIGRCGGDYHLESSERIDRYKNDDNGFLQNTLDDESYEFFRNINIDPIQVARVVDALCPPDYDDQDPHMG